MVGAQENIVPASEALADGITQTHYEASITLWNINIHLELTYPLEDVNMQLTFPITAASSTPNIAPFEPLLTKLTYPQLGHYAVHHEPPASTIGQAQVALAGSIGLSTAQGSELIYFSRSGS